MHTLMEGGPMVALKLSDVHLLQNNSTSKIALTDGDSCEFEASRHRPLIRSYRTRMIWGVATS